MEFKYLYLKSLADPGGGDAARAPPNRINFFGFHIRFHRKVYVLEVGVPPTGRRPPNGKSWIRHCKYYNVSGNDNLKEFFLLNWPTLFANLWLITTTEKPNLLFCFFIS